MKIELSKFPKSPTIIEGFPGFGLIGTIVTEFLIEHLNAELIGEFFYDDMPATVAIHKNKLVKPMAVYFDKTHNLLILHTILNTKGFEWKIANSIVTMAKKLKAKEIISIEGVGSIVEEQETKLYSYGSEKLKKLGIQPVKESIIMGVTAAIMLRYPKMTCIFADTHSTLPDSKAAAKVIEALDKYLGLKVDYHPLIKQADEFESKLKNIMKQSSKSTEERDRKSLSYLG